MRLIKVFQKTSEEFTYLSAEDLVSKPRENVKIVQGSTLICKLPEVDVVRVSRYFWCLNLFLRAS